MHMHIAVAIYACHIKYTRQMLAAPWVEPKVQQLNNACMWTVHPELYCAAL